MVIDKRFYWPKIKEDVKHLFTLVLKTKIPSPFTKINMEFINLYQSLVSHGIMCP